MADYKSMYLEVLSSSQKAINELIAAQIRAEEIYLSSPADPILIQQKQQSSDKNKTCT